MNLRLMLVCLLSAGAINAAEITFESLTVGSRTYRDVRIIGANDTDLYFNHSEGIANVRLKYLDEAMQKRFNYDPKLAAQGEARQEQDDFLWQRSIASNVTAIAEKAARLRKNETRSSPVNIVDAISDSSPVGKAAPALRFQFWTAEPPAIEAKPVLVYFWAPWSLPCRKANAELGALLKKFGPKIAVIGVANSADLEAEIPAEAKPGFATAKDVDGRYASAAGITSVPAIMLIDQERKVRYQGHPGAITEEALEKLIAPPD